MYLPTPSYTFVTYGGQRQFVHRWQLNNNEIIECNKCGSTCNQTDAYSKHWLQKNKNSYGKHEKITNELNANVKNDWSTVQETTLAAAAAESRVASRATTPLNELVEQLRQAIDSSNKNIKSFMLCDNRQYNIGKGQATFQSAAIAQQHQQFLLDSGIEIVPDLLRALFDYSTKELHVKLRFYLQMEQDANDAGNDVDVADVTDEIFMLQTSELSIQNHFDIRESVDMIFAMSLEKLQKKNLRQCYDIKRIKIQVRRLQENSKAAAGITKAAQLPLQYKLKANTIFVDNKNIQQQQQRKHMELQQQLKQCFNHETDVATAFSCLSCNLYCFQVCENSQELFVVPYHIDESNSTLPNYIIMQDVLGNFQNLLEISNLKRFLRYSPADQVLSCRHCQMKFMQRTQLILHELLQCGNQFELKSMPRDHIEIYEKCLLLKKCPKWSLYGIIDE